MVKLKVLLTLIMILAAYSSTKAAYGEAMYFNSLSDLRELGITITEGGRGGGDLNNHCYSYSQIDGDISISNHLLSLYKQRGFTLRSACMALTSFMSYNPETGQRLTTYVLLSSFTDGTSKLFTEHPFALPRCFARALPYSDCQWKYDMYDGRRLSSRETESVRKIGERIEKYLKLRLWRHEKTESLGGNARSFPFDLEKGGPFNEPNGAVYFDYSSDFPTGYGYSVGSQGELGAIPNPEVIRKASDKSRPKPQVDPEALRKLLDTGSH